MRISLFITCFNDTLFTRTGIAVVTILERLGHRVDFPRAQTCCGQMHLNTGYEREALPVVRHFVDVFDRAEVIVTPSASCAGTVIHQYAAVADRAKDASLRKAVDRIGLHLFEFSTFLVERLGVEDVGAYFPRRVAYHPTCHSLRGLGVGDAPERLLRAVRAIDLVCLEGRESCCGFGGTFALKNADVSNAMAIDKTAAVIATGAEVCTAVDNSCLLQIGGLLARRNSAVRVAHLAEILASDGKGSR